MYHQSKEQAIAKKKNEIFLKDQQNYMNDAKKLIREHNNEKS